MIRRMSESSSEKREIVVLGAGIVGIACALNLVRDGHDVTVVDRVLPGEGCSRGNAGMLAATGYVPMSLPGIAAKVPGMLLDPSGPLSLRWRDLPQLAPWMLAFLRQAKPDIVARTTDALHALNGTSVEDHQRLARGTKAAELIRPCRYLYAYPDRRAYEKSAYEMELRRQRGARIETYEGDAVREIEPALSERVGFVAAMDDNGYVLEPMLLTKRLAEALMLDGGKVLKRTVRDVETGADGTVRLVCPEGDLEAATLVVAAGAFSGWIAEKLGHRVPLVGERGYHVTLPNAGVVPRNPIMSTAHKFVATPMEGGLRFAGTAEFAALDAPPNMARARRLLKLGAELIPGIDVSGHTEWMGQRPSLPDSLPVIGRSPQRGNVYFAFGHHHLGLTGAPKTGEMIADLITGRRPNVDLTPFRVDRFA